MLVTMPWLLKNYFSMRNKDYGAPPPSIDWQVINTNNIACTS